jgi:predicted acetyltransferase
MPMLLRPTAAVRESFLAALDEFRAEGRLGEHDRTGLAFETRDLAPDADDAAFDAHAAMLRNRSNEEAPRPEGWVPDTLLWYVDGSEWIGRLDIRHRLTPFLLEAGGHIGYDVRPSMRRRGYATAMLREALPIAADLGIDPALITCRFDNVGSRKVIEANGGVFEDQRGDILRFWIPTSTSNADEDELLDQLLELIVDGVRTDFISAAYVPPVVPADATWALIVTDADPPIGQDVGHVEFTTESGVSRRGRVTHEGQRQLKYLTVLLNGHDVETADQRR